MNDPYDGSGRKNTDDLARDIEREVRRTFDAVAVTLKDAAREVSGDENIRRTVRDLGEAARSGVQGVREGVARAREAAEGESRKKRRRKKRDYAKKATGALGEAGGMLLPAGILAACAVANWVEESEIAGTAILGIIALWFLAGSVAAFFKSRTLRRIASYQGVLGGRAYCSVEELADMAGKSPAAVRRDLHRLISMGKYEDVYLAPDGSRLFSSETAYRLYRAHAEQRAEAQREAARAPEPQPEQPAPGVLDECRDFVRELREQQRLLTDASVLEQTQRIEAQTARIIAWLERHPAGEGQIRRFVSYYMPTTLKLLRTYNEVAPQAASSSVAAEIQANICGMLGTINTAFQSLQNNLLKDTAMDVSAEITALETVLAQEGLTQDGMLG